MKTCYVWSQDLINHCNRLPAVPRRAELVHSLIGAYGLLKHVQVVNSKPASYEDLKDFHSELYLDHLKTIQDVDDEYETTPQDEEYGLGYDCPPISQMFELVSQLAGGSITAARCLTLGLCSVAINWCGGWHHAGRFGAEGFCYVNDIVLAIGVLRKKYPKVLYIDLDVHHGNGVEDAFNLSKTVFTLSFHKHEPGFYPGTGSVGDVGSLVGKGYCCNVPLQAHYSDETFVYVFERTLDAVCIHFAPDAVVVQCGADALARDPHGGANLTELAYCRCVGLMLERAKPTLLIGGGGYNHTNTARLWTCITARVLNRSLSEDIPEHDDFDEYAPEYTLPVKKTLIKDPNQKSYLDDIIGRIKDNLTQYIGPPPPQVPQSTETST
ncbi:hypothetical protein JYU34_012065 [Plutella xylostella]|uniref:Histone deacetylase n=1 Tax=Plutella xylostella TaxID=51655 RepID=A0ABQ7QE86_PLUXY|nr:hypothetical protein JYU34_012065 [Plutella xylostella]